MSDINNRRVSSSPRHQEDYSHHHPEREEKRVSVFRFYFINFLLLFVIVIILTFGVAVMMCSVKDVVCTGSTVYTDAELKKIYLSGGKYNGNTIYVFFKNRFSPTKVKDIPFIEDYTISIQDRNTLRIDVVEKPIVGYIDTEDGKRAYFDAEGVVQEISDIDFEGVTKVSGLKLEDIKQGEVLPIGTANIKTIAKVLDGIKENDLTDVTEVVFSNEGTIVLNAGDITLNLGTRASMTEKLRRAKYILPKLKDKKGTLHLEEWTDENTDIVFQYSSN